MKHGRVAMMLAGGLAAALAVTPALAAHGKVGLWKITVSMQNPAMGQISSSDQAQMRAMGIQMQNAHTVTVDHCMTQDEVNSDQLSAASARQQGCELENLKTAGHTFSGDMVCKGQMKGRGHMTVTYDSPEHYSGKMQFSGTAHGQPVSMTNTYDGRWVKADCGGVKH